MIEGWALIGIFILGLIGIIIFTSRFKIHAFVTMFFTAVIIGIVTGITPLKMVDLVISGFGSVLGYIAIIVVSATIIGEILDKTGATLAIFGQFYQNSRQESFSDRNGSCRISRIYTPYVLRYGLHSPFTPSTVIIPWK